MQRLKVLYFWIVAISIIFKETLFRCNTYHMLVVDCELKNNKRVRIVAQKEFGKLCVYKQEFDFEKTKDTKKK